jgi:ABC-type glycerol-3-phosphate transport system substrate-binding protein
MVRGTCRRGAFRVGVLARAAVAAAACALAACAGTSQFTLGGTPAGTTVAFESIDGPPEAVFRKLVTRLNEEAATRKIAVVSRDQTAQYRIRGYLAARAQGRRVTLAWVWDVYTVDQQRAMRIAGETAGVAGERAWAAADDKAIGRLARDGMERLAAFLAAPPAPAEDAPAAPTPDNVPPNVAFAPAEAATVAYVPSRPQ